MALNADHYLNAFIGAQEQYVGLATNILRYV